MIDTFLHKWLKLPHRLHVGIDSGPKDAPVTIVLIHGLGSSNKMWQQTIHKAGRLNARVLAVDLLGFGESPKPEWQTYSAATHAKALRAALRKYHVKGHVIIAGHSLGGLVAVQYATRYPWAVQSLILCSPPFYKPVQDKAGAIMLLQIDDLYRRFYRYARTRKELARKIAMIVKQARLIDPNFTVNDETIPAIASSLEMSIENQTSIHDARGLTIPMTIVYGRLDPFILARNLKMIEKGKPNVTLVSVTAGHDIIGSKAYTAKVADLIKKEAEAYLA